MDEYQSKQKEIEYFWKEMGGEENGLSRVNYKRI